MDAGLIGRGLRLLPAGLRGKTRLAKWLRSRLKSRQSLLIRDGEHNRYILPNLDEPVALSLWMNGRYEPDTYRFLVDSIRPESTFIDVGANIGAFSIPIARRLVPGSGTVLSIEASPRIFPLLERNVELNRLENIKMINCAASDGLEHEIEFYEAPLEQFGMGSCAPQFNGVPHRVPAASLDAILESQGLDHLDLLKVDVEGWEAKVFQGSLQLLSAPRSPKIVFEYCDWAEERAFAGKAGLAQAILLELGFQLWRLPDYLKKSAPLSQPIRHGAEMIVAIRA